MKVTYIYHSSFLVETRDCYYLFDYYRGTLPDMDPDKPVIVFASHAHRDHYNKEVFLILHERGMKWVTAVLSKDISRRNYPAGIEVIRVRHDEEYGLPHGARLRTLLSTDAGVAFLVTCPEATIFHAGDLNDWVWEGEPEQDNRQMTGSYSHEIQKLKDIPIDIAFFPLDPRQEDHYARGMLYFLEHVSVRQVYPMHFWEKPEIIEKFLLEYPVYNDKISSHELISELLRNIVMCRKHTQ